MADLSIRKDFVDDVQDIFTTLFNDGVNDGLNLCLLSDKTKTSIYGECKYKKYKAPIKLVCHARIESLQGAQTVEVIKKQSQFVVPFKEMQLKGLDVSKGGLDEIRKGVIEFHGTYYDIEEVLPRVYIEDVFLFYHFVCTENKEIQEISVESGENDE